MSRVVLAMSGVVDSSGAAHLLVEQGHEVIGIFMRHGQQSPVACATAPAENPNSQHLPIVNRLDHKQGCCTAADAEDAQRVADKMGLPFYALNLQEEFSRIIDYFVDEYTTGRTPNPCVQCNNWIKFGKLFDYADSVGAEYVATGHYARMRQSGSGKFEICRGRDSHKDQSYVLFGVKRAHLAKMMLPVGDYEKPQIRQMAADLGMRVADKQDSQEICFVSEGRYDAFVRGRREHLDTSGDLVTVDGAVVGKHDGIEGFTVGQRKGLGVALGEPKFVVRIEPETRRVVIGDRCELMRSTLTARQVNWHETVPFHQPKRCYAQIRYNSQAAAATVQCLPDERLQIEFEQPQFGVAPGQAVVCYDPESNQRVLAGGWIE